MATLIESAIAFFSKNRNDAALRALDLALVQDEVVIPVSSDVTAIDTNSYDVPIICIKTKTGDGAIPAFTTIEQLLKWKPEGCRYVTLKFTALLEMARRMPEISIIVINVDGAPRGAIPRSEFDRLITLGSAAT